VVRKRKKKELQRIVQGFGRAARAAGAMAADLRRFADAVSALKKRGGKEDA